MLLLLLFLRQSLSSLNEPPNGKLFLSAWLDTADSNQADRPLKFNSRMKMNISCFQYAQNIPIDTFPFPYEQITQTKTDALVYLTVYPRPNPWQITDEQISNLTKQLSSINNDSRRVLLRFAPEMNGNWNYWGQQPTQFLKLWKRIFTAIRRDAPLTALVWAPSSGNGYPYTTNANHSPQDLLLLDTNKDGKIDSNDDPYSPYYPGDDYVDWVGMSIYYYGPKWPWQDNTIPPQSSFLKILNQNDFYTLYARKKPMMIAETGAAYHTRTPSGPGELAIKQAFWKQYLTNQTFLKDYSNIKMISLFEFKKFEDFLSDGREDERDFRVSFDTEIRERFLNDFKEVKDLYVLANFTADDVKKSLRNSKSAGVESYWSMFISLLIIFFHFS